MAVSINGALIEMYPDLIVAYPLYFHFVLTNTYIVYPATMKTTLNIDEEILRKASRLTGISEITTLVRMGLEALIANESAKRLAALGGSEKQLKSIPRRKTMT